MAVGKKFATGVEELEQLVGEGVLVGKIVVDQAYAQRQHEQLSLRHDDGTANFLELSLTQQAPIALQSIAQQVLEGGIVAGMIEAMEDLNKVMEQMSPELFGDLKDSGNVIVLDGGSEVYNRPPAQHRLSAEEIRDKHRRIV